MGISVIICCYNSSLRLPKTLEYLSNQATGNLFPWEIILVDNNSSDNTSVIATNFWASLDIDVPLIIVEESKPGLIYARNTGINKANYDFLIFCDDDNWLNKNYLCNVYKILNNNLYLCQSLFLFV
jgi:glycosyltransferase involved in cell wall biosynthesis